MENSRIKKNENKIKRKMRVRRSLRGDEAKPRLCVVKTNAHIHIQLINDEIGKTLCSTSTLAPEFKNAEFGKANKVSGKQLGLKIAELALKKNVKRAVFDRGSSKYHGVIGAVAEGAREGGLEI